MRDPCSNPGQGNLTCEYNTFIYKNVIILNLNLNKFPCRTRSIGF